MGPTPEYPITRIVDLGGGGGDTDDFRPRLELEADSHRTVQRLESWMEASADPIPVQVETFEPPLGASGVAPLERRTDLCRAIILDLIPREAETFEARALL